MIEHLEQQLVNELRSVLDVINGRYKDFFHINLITLCDLKDMMCDACMNSTTGQRCKRCVIGVMEVENGQNRANEDNEPELHST